MKYEDSKADKMADKKNAKKAGMSVSKWEGSKGDKMADAKMKAKMMKKGKK